MKIINKANPTRFVIPTTLFNCPTDVAILLATYNGDRFLSQQLDSILNQTSQNWTLYINDDGSNDSTQSIIDKYVRKYPDKIIDINAAKHQGCSNNFYSLIFSVNAKYYMICDQDDYWIPSKVELSVNEIRKYNGPVIVASYATLCDSELNPIEPDFWSKTGMRDKLLTWNYAGVCCSIPGAEMIFNSTLRECLWNKWDNNLTYDHWILMIAIKYGKVFNLPIQLRYYRQHENNVFGANTSYGKKQFILDKLKSLVKDYFLLKEVGYGSIIKYIYYRCLIFIRIKIKK